MARIKLKVYEELITTALCEADGRSLTAQKMLITLVHMADLAEQMNLIYLNDFSENLRDMIIDHNRVSAKRLKVPEFKRTSRG